MDRSKSTPNASGAKPEEPICGNCGHVFVPSTAYGRCQYCEDHRILRNGGLGGLVEADLPMYSFEENGMSKRS